MLEYIRQVVKQTAGMLGIVDNYTVTVTDSDGRSFTVAQFVSETEALRIKVAFYETEIVDTTDVTVEKTNKRRSETLWTSNDVSILDEQKYIAVLNER